MRFCVAVAPRKQAQSELKDGEDRVFTTLHKEARIEPGDAEQRLSREMSYDPDLWIVEVEDRQGRCFLDLAGQA